MKMKRWMLSILFLGSLLLPLAFGTIFAADKITLEVWHVHNAANSRDGAAMEEVYREYEKAHPGIKINLNAMTYADLRQKALVAGQAGQGPDVLHMLVEWVAEFAKAGIITDITNWVDEWEDEDKFPESTWQVTRVDGRCYGIPSVASTRLLLYREDLFKKAGIKAPPKTWSELRAVAKKLASNNMAGFAFCSATTAIRGPQEFLVFLWSTGAELVKKENGKYVPGFTVEQVQSVFQLYYDLIFVDKAVPLYTRGWEWQNLDQAFEAGTVAMCQNGSWMLYRAERAKTGKMWKTAPFPYSKVPATYLEVKVEGIGAFSKYKKEAWDLLKFVYNKENMARITKYDNLPSRSDVMNLPFYTSDPVWKKAFMEVIPTGHTVPPIPLTPILRASMEGVQEVIYERMKPAEAAKVFYDKVAEYLKTL
ncbi:MAG: sugar ABC transporter substrate-binding protein [Firmicutes bacterium]|nr:sugar ABC transporter substrate-binding protein [Bacillota bacterium]